MWKVDHTTTTTVYKMVLPLACLTTRYNLDFVEIGRIPEGIGQLVMWFIRDNPGAKRGLSVLDFFITFEGPEVEYARYNETTKNFTLKRKETERCYSKTSNAYQTSSQK